MSKLERLYDRSDIRWAHPETEEGYGVLGSLDTVATEAFFNQELPREDRAEKARELTEMIHSMLAGTDNGPVYSSRETVVAPGCPEEPDASVELIIFRPQEPKQDPLPVIYAIPGGGMYQVALDNFSLYWRAPDMFDCVVVCPHYRTVFEARYPGAMNDLHAGYQYVVEHAEELGVDPDRIVLNGASSGSNLALSLAHRLKRYGYRPRGCVVTESFADNRPTSETCNFNGPWSGKAQWMSSLEYLGPNNFALDNTPEMYPNYATAEECVGLCPTFIHCDCEEGNTSGCKDYSTKLTLAGVYNEIHVWGGAVHGVADFSFLNVSPVQPYAQRYWSVFSGNVTDCFKYDLRRSWIQELLED